MTDMRYRQLGDSGLTVSVVGLGCNNFRARTSDENAHAVIDAAIERGITLFDTADIYGGGGGSEELIGEALGSRRDQVVLATKFGMEMPGAGPEARGSRRYVRKAVRDSLTRLRTDWIDLYQYHEPDGVTPIEETLAALHELVQEGLVRYVGSSNFAGWQIADASWTARDRRYEPFVSAQNHYSLLERGIEREVVPACEQYGVGQLPYFPLANGVLTGKYRRGEPLPEGSRLGGNATRAEQLLTERTYDRVEALEKLAESRGVTLLHLAIGGLAAQPSVSSVIAGATRPEQVHANADAGTWEPSAEDLVAIDEICPPGE
ncbi:MAG TPA: aldo/keto reductase [Frankiaceae bacterium]|jgi:aryl-alcohol dehydrogenase-like predicted oxidoreductase|nr:aldo/keto reductase [Frankiaceae bacterium]